jgi:RNA polymerase sigma factor (sigma-70 family)
MCGKPPEWGARLVLGYERSHCSWQVGHCGGGLAEGPSRDIEGDIAVNNEIALLAYYQNANDENFSHFARSVTPMIADAAQKMLAGGKGGGPDTIDEVTNKVLAKVARTRESGSAWNPEKGSLNAWLKTITKNECRNFWRKRKNRFPAFTELETTRNLFSGEESVFGEVFADKRSIDPAAAFWKTERRTKLDQAIDRLPELEKTVIGWHFFEQRSQTEIANLLGVSDATVSRAKRDALKKLKQFLPEVHDCLGLSA